MRPKLNHRGSFLIEVLLCVTILSISLTFIVQSMAASLRANVYSSEYMLALNIADNKMFELFKQQSIASGLQKEEKVQVGDKEFGYSLETEALTGTGFDDLNQATVAIEWQRTGKTNRIQLVTYLFQPIENATPSPSP